MRLAAIVFIIIVIPLVVLMARAFIRNAVALKRDVDKRFDDLEERLADQATSIVEPLLEKDRTDRSK
jgi:hypothetical protein